MESVPKLDLTKINQTESFIASQYDATFDANLEESQKVEVHESTKAGRKSQIVKSICSKRYKPLEYEFGEILHEGQGRLIYRFLLKKSLAMKKKNEGPRPIEGVFAARQVPQQYFQEGTPQEQTRLWNQMIIEMIAMDNLKGDAYLAKPVEMARTKKNLYLVQEFCNGGGSLRQYINSKGGNLPESEAKPIIQKIIECVTFIFSQQLINKDVNLDKLLLHQPEEDDDDWASERCSELPDAGDTSPGANQLIAQDSVSVKQHEAIIQKKMQVKMSDLGFTRASEAASFGLIQSRINLIMSPTPEHLRNKVEIIGIGVLALQLLTGVDLMFTDQDAKDYKKRVPDKVTIDLSESVMTFLQTAFIQPEKEEDTHEDILEWDQFEYIADSLFNGETNQSVKPYTFRFSHHTPQSEDDVEQYMFVDGTKVKFQVLCFQQFYERCALQVSDKIRVAQIAKRNKSSYFIKALKEEKKPGEIYKIDKSKRKTAIPVADSVILHRQSTDQKIKFSSQQIQTGQGSQNNRLSTEPQEFSSNQQPGLNDGTTFETLIQQNDTPQNMSQTSFNYEGDGLLPQPKRQKQMRHSKQLKILDDDGNIIDATGKKTESGVCGSGNSCERIMCSIF